MVAEIRALDGSLIDVVVVRDIELEGQRITVQSIHMEPGMLSEFLYLPSGNVTIDGTRITVRTEGWRLLFWESGTSNKCINPNGPVYCIDPQHPHGVGSSIQ